MFKITNCREGPQYIWPRHVIFLNQQGLRDQAKKRLYVWKGLYHARSNNSGNDHLCTRPIAAYYFQGSPCQPALQNFWPWIEIIRDLVFLRAGPGYNKCHLDDNSWRPLLFSPGRQNPRILFFPFPFFFRSLYFLSCTFANYWTSVWDSHSESNMTSLKVWREKSRTPSKALIKVAIKARRAENQVSGKS